MQLRRPLTITTLAAVLVAPAAPASATHIYAPQGGDWKTNGESSPTDYCETPEATTVPRRKGIEAWQRALNLHGAQLDITGRYDPPTADAVRAFEQANFLPPDGCVGFRDARHLLAQQIRNAARRAGIPAEHVARVAWNESVFDPGAVGPDGHDWGIAQWTEEPAAEQGLSMSETWDVDKALTAAAKRLAAYHRRIGDWQITIVSHWSPGEALAWKRTGNPSTEALDYSRRAERFPGLPDSVQNIDGSPAGSKPAAPGHAGPKPGSDYRVQQGDTAWRIATNAYGDGRKWKEIARANGRPDNPAVRAGEVIRIPLLGSNTQPAKPTRPTPTGPTAGTDYRVQSGDTMWRIAVKAYGGGKDERAGQKWRDIAAANGRPGNPAVRSGEVIRIPVLR